MDGRIVQVRPGQDDWEDFQRDLAKGRAAILMVAEGHARSVVLDNLPLANRVAPILVPMAQRQGICFRVERHGDGTISLIVGPRSSVA